MTQETQKKKVETPENIRNSEEKEVNLIPFSPESSPTFLGFKLKNVGQLWDWRTLEDVKF